MATETLKKRTTRMQLDNGTDGDGNQRTVSINITGVSTSGYSADKYIAIAAAIEPCLSKTIYALEVVATSAVTAQ